LAISNSKRHCEGGTTEAIHCFMVDDNLKQIASQATNFIRQSFIPFCYPYNIDSKTQLIKMY